MWIELALSGWVGRILSQRMDKFSIFGLNYSKPYNFWRHMLHGLRGRDVRSINAELALLSTIQMTTQVNIKLFHIFVKIHPFSINLRNKCALDCYKPFFLRPQPTFSLKYNFVQINRMWTNLSFLSRSSIYHQKIPVLLSH